MDQNFFSEKLSQRQSIGAKFLSDPVPSETDYLEALKAAVAAPNHLSTNQCRLVLINNREKLADFFEAGALNAGAPQEEARKTRSKALKAPALLALIVKIEEHNIKVPVYEQWMTAGAFLMQIINCLEDKNFSLKVVSGSSTQYADVVKALCKEGEQVSCWIMVGSAKEKPDRAKRVDAEEFFSVY